MDRLIPAGTGFEYYRNVRIPADEPLPPSDDELESWSATWSISWSRTTSRWRRRAGISGSNGQV